MQLGIVVFKYNGDKRFSSIKENDVTKWGVIQEQLDGRKRNKTNVIIFQLKN